MGMISIPVTSDTKRRKRKRASEVGWISDGGNFILCACEASVRVRIYETNAGDVFHLLVCCCSLSLSLMHSLFCTDANKTQAQYISWL